MTDEIAMASQTNRALARAYSFGDPEPVLDTHQIMDLFHSLDNGRFYEPPISLDGLNRIYSASPYHQSAIQVKANILLGALKPSRYLRPDHAKRLFLNYLIFGNAYPVKRKNVLGGLHSIETLPTLWTRKKKDGSFILLEGIQEKPIHEDVIHIMEPDMTQEVYGKPYYTGVIQAALLSEDCTLFRRRYYKNGSHAGFILYLNDPNLSDDDLDAIEEALENSKGSGNFKNLFIYSPGGKEGGIKHMPIAEVAAKDEFFNLKTVARDEQLAAHRVPPQILGVVPQNAGGFGDVGKAAQVFVMTEIKPLMRDLMVINDLLNIKVIDFGDVEIAGIV